MSHSQLNRPSRMSSGAGDDSDCTILHIDMDAFYASVELLSRPHLRGQPVIVGGSGNRGVVLSATYEARAMGVHSAMPMARARRACPNAVIIAPDHRRYARASAGVMEVFRSITDLMEPLSLDEAFLDVSGAVRRLGRPVRIAEMIRARVHDEQGLVASVGVASTKFVAKLASTRAKPDGLLLVPTAEVVPFLHPLPVGALWGVGARTEEQLHRLGLRTVGDIARTPVRTLQRALGDAAGRHLAELAWGRDPRRVQRDEPERSIGAEETFPVDVDDPEVLGAELLRLSDKVAARLRAAGLIGHTVVLKVRFADFTTLTRSRTVDTPLDVGQEIYGTASALLDALGLQRARVRLVGVRVENLRDAADAPRQLVLGAREQGWREAEQAVDRAADRYGRGSVRPARLVQPRPWDDDDPAPRADPERQPP
jgi:DNA polymerase-4